MELSRPLSTITPTLDGDVLAVLARNDSEFTTGQLSRILGGPSEEGIRKVLQRLTKQGTVRSSRVGNTYTYRLNRNHLAAEHIIGLARLQENLLSRLKERMESWEIPPLYAAVFGSAARGSMTAASDLDLFLVRHEGADDETWEAQVEQLVNDVTLWTGNDTRPLEFTDAEIARKPLNRAVLLKVVEEGLTVFGTRVWLSTQLRSGRD